MRLSTGGMVAFAFGLLLPSCGQTEEDYRVVEREYVPASEVPGIDDIDLEQVSYPVMVGSVAIAEQFPDLVWPDMVNEERWRLGLSPPGELLYPRNCLFVSPARKGIGTVRRIINGEVIFFRIHRAAGIEPGECPTQTDSSPDPPCYRITALSESSGMCTDSIATDRLASFDVVNDQDSARIIHFRGDEIRFIRMRVANGCPRFDDESESLEATGSESQYLVARTDENEAVHLLWHDRSERPGESGLRFVQSALRYIKLGPDLISSSEDVVTVSRSAQGGGSFNLLLSAGAATAAWIDLRFSQRFLFKVSNPNKLLLYKIREQRTRPELLAINQPFNNEDNAFSPVISSVAADGVWLAWGTEIQDLPPGPSIQIAWSDFHEAGIFTSEKQKRGQDLREHLMQRLTRYHRRLGRGPDGPLPPLECTRDPVDLQGESIPGVVVPGNGFQPIGRGDADPDSDEDGGG